MVNKDEMDSYLMELKKNTPEEIKHYQKIIANRNAIMAEADKARNDAKLEAAVKEFYKKTGVYPYIYIIEETEFPSYDLSVKYRDVFGDSEENFIILYAVTVYERHGETHDGFYFGVGNDVEGTIDTDVRRVILESMESRMDGKHDMADVFGKALKDAASLFGEQYD